MQWQNEGCFDDLEEWLEREARWFLEGKYVTFCTNYYVIVGNWVCDPNEYYPVAAFCGFGTPLGYCPWQP
ncbi:MAG: hypothetical protein GY762_23010 [Proteobacteria bacterium]|nr:hypothetical protein [Pseudomonadota bacterium]